MLLLDGQPTPQLEANMDSERLNGMLRRVTRTVPVEGVEVIEETWVPGRILQLWRELVQHTDALPRRDKPGVKFKVRDASELIDKVREASNSLGILIYPGMGTEGKGIVTDNGTLADVNMVLIAQAVEDGSLLAFAGYGQGADSQDKAGGKGMTYAHKAILIQALLMGGSKTAKALGVRDTDDTDTPIKGGVRQKAERGSLKDLAKRLGEVEDKDDYEVIKPELQALVPEDQMKLKAEIVAAKERAGITPSQTKAKS